LLHHNYTELCHIEKENSFESRDTLIAVHAMHADRDIVLPILSVRLSVQCWYCV